MDVGIYQRMGSVYYEHCLVRTIGANIYVKGGKRYQITMKILAEASAVNPRQPENNTMKSVGTPTVLSRFVSLKPST
ncbi:hypothetical protein TNCV_2167191 [Trichonephila clavipes]|nr:hypothetical protein TNCV_2167191 [Trichonephila clavipes]